jgi:hypothetical protein
LAQGSGFLLSAMAQRGRDIPEGLLELYGVDPTGGASPWSRIDPVGVGLMGAGATGLMMNKRKKGEEENSSSGPSELPAGMYRELIRSLGR